MSTLDSIWPANFKPVNLHYDGEPFRSTVLFAQEDNACCRKIVKPKGLRVPNSFFPIEIETETIDLVAMDDVVSVNLSRFA